MALLSIVIIVCCPCGCHRSCCHHLQHRCLSCCSHWSSSLMSSPTSLIAVPIAHIVVIVVIVIIVAVAVAIAITIAIAVAVCPWFQLHRTSDIYCMAIATKSLTSSSPQSAADPAAVVFATALERSIINAAAVASSAVAVACANDDGHPWGTT
jgi:hypothetical protein